MITKSPIAVLISDIHYNINTLSVADASMRQAVSKANTLNVPLVVCGDLHDTKANIRGECIKAMLDTFKLCQTKVYVIVGNHCKINEKSKEHSLEFLSSVTYIINEPTEVFLAPKKKVMMLPYHSEPFELRKELAQIKKSTTIIMHQGVSGSNSGEYIQDKSAISKDDVASRRIISGHYHTRQTIELPDNGVWDYVGNPYTLNFAEANDPDKGYQVLYSDYSLEFVSTNLRKHVVIGIGVESYSFTMDPNQYLPRSNDIVKVKAKGLKIHLNALDKVSLANVLCNIPFKLDLIPTDKEASITKEQTSNKTQPEILDSLIDSLTDSEASRRDRLKRLWKDFK